MNQGFSIFLSGARREKWQFRIDFFWVLGLFLGVLSGWFFGGLDDALIRDAAAFTVSQWSFPAWLILFPILSVLIYFGLRPELLAVVCFLKAFSMAFVSMDVCTAFGSAGWLLWFLMMFSDILFCPLLYCFWLQLPFCSPGEQIAAFLGIVIFSVLIGWIDYRMVLPFTATLIKGCRLSL